MRTDHLVKAKSKNCVQSLECVFHVSGPTSHPVRIELCCFILSKVRRWWCLLSAWLTQLILVCCLLSYCLARALKVQSDKIAKRNGKSPIHFPFLPPSNQPYSNISLWQFILNELKILILEWIMHLLNFMYSSLALELRVWSKFLGGGWEYFCEHLLVLNQIWYCYFS